MRLDRAVELAQVAERQGELEVRIHMLRIARERAARVGRGKLEQAALVVLLRTEGGFHQRRPGGERIAVGACEGPTEFRGHEEIAHTGDALPPRRVHGRAAARPRSR